MILVIARAINKKLNTWIHCSDSETILSAIDIQKMHLGFGWDGIGYHKIIKRSGVIENGKFEYGLEHTLKVK